MAKIRLAKQVEPKLTMYHPDIRATEKHNPSPAVEMASNLYSSSSSTSSCSSSPEDREDEFPSSFEDLINGMRNVRIAKIPDSDVLFKSVNLPTSSDDNSRVSFSHEDDEDDDEGLIERGPVRPQLHPLNRAKPYVDAISAHHWTSSGVNLQSSENSTDYDTSAKEILTDREYRERIDSCLNKLSDTMSQEHTVSHSLSPAHSDFGGTSGNSPHQHQQQQLSPGQLSNISSRYVPSITICDSESSLLEILSRGGFQAAQASRTPEYNSGASVASSTFACGAPDVWPDSPASSYNNCATSASRPESRTSSRAQSPGSNNGCGAVSFLNVLGSPGMESPQVSPQNFRNLQRPSSSSSSSQSYCETPSPANYMNPLEQHLEEELGDEMLSRMPAWRDSFESSDTIVDGYESNSELQFQLVEEIIRNDMLDRSLQRVVQSPPDMQVVPDCRAQTPASTSVYATSSYTMTGANYAPSCAPQSTGAHVPTGYVPRPTYAVSSRPHTVTSSQMMAQRSVQQQQQQQPMASAYAEQPEMTDDLANTLLRFIGGEEAVCSDQVGADTRSSTTASGYSSSSSSSEAWRVNDNACLQTDQPSTSSNLAGSSRQHQPQQQTVYHHHHQQQQTQQTQQTQQHCMNMSSAMSVENTSYANISMRRNSWQNSASYAEPTPMASHTNQRAKNFGEFQIPKAVTSYNSQRSRSVGRCSGGGLVEPPHIVPWPSLNMPQIQASERLKESTNNRAVLKAMHQLLKMKFEELSSPDEDGDTMLMCLVGNPEELDKKLAFLVPLVERLGTVDGALTMLNHRGEDALYLAAVNSYSKPYVAGYLAATFVQKNINISQRTYRNRGDTLVHVVASKGDSHGEVLTELLSLKTAQGNPVFDLSKRNYDGRTALHLAAEAHLRSPALATIRLLMDSGVDPTAREGRCGDTALHMAVSLSNDPNLISVMTNGRGADAVNIFNYDGNTPLHLAGALSERTSLERQINVCKALLLAGGRSNLPNRQGKTPLALVMADRKDALRKVFHKKL